MYDSREDLTDFDLAVGGGFLVIVGLALLMYFLPMALDAVVVEEKHVTIEKNLEPGDLAISGTRYVGVTGNTVEFREGDKTLKYVFESGKEIKLRPNRAVTLKELSGDRLSISEKRYERVNKFSGDALPGQE